MTNFVQGVLYFSIYVVTAFTLLSDGIVAGTWQSWAMIILLVISNLSSLGTGYLLGRT